MRFSIVIPNYNYEKFVQNTVLSVLRQDYSDIEIVIVDDGSTDNSVNVIQSIINDFPEKSIKLICQTNSGQSNAINTGLSHVTGDIIGWINSDDYYMDGTFTKVAKSFLDNDVSVVFGDINVVDIDGNYIYSLYHFDFSFFWHHLQVLQTIYQTMPFFGEKMHIQMILS